MAKLAGRCVNFGACSVADDKMTRFAAEREFLCPVCGSPLIQVTPHSRGPLYRLLRLVMALVVVMLIVAAVRWLVHAWWPAPAPPPPPHVVVRLEGSRNLGESLTPQLVQAFLESRKATGIATRERVGQPKVISGWLPSERVWLDFRIQSGESDSAFDALTRHSAEIGMSSRASGPADAPKLNALGCANLRDCEHVVALDGIAVIVNTANRPVKSYPLSELKDIFSGQIRDWRAAGGGPGKINIYCHAPGSGTTETFSQLVLDGAPVGPCFQTLPGSAAVREAVRGDPNGIGLVAIPYLAGVKELAVGDTGASLLRPTPFTVSTEDYALTRRLYFYTAAKKSRWTQAFLDFVVSDQGQETVEKKSDFVSLRIHDAAPQPEYRTPDYIRTTKGARRLNTTFHFRSADDVLDTRAWDDVERVSYFLKSQGYEGKNILLLGFTDSDGGDTRAGKERNLTFSFRRAQSVSLALEQIKMAGATLKGFGQDMPVSANSTAIGKARNRRVEIWIQ